MSRYTAALDANVLYPAPLRDLFMQLALTALLPPLQQLRSNGAVLEKILAAEPEDADAALRIVSVRGFQPLPLNKILSASISVIITVMGSTGEAMNP